MQIPLYKEVHNAQPDLDNNAHRGLYFDKFFNEYNDQWEIKDEAKSNWINKVTKKVCGNENQLKQQQKRLLALADALGHAQTQIFETTWHFATGLGLPHPIENGLIWHPTLGVPYLPASSIKGLLKAWQRDWTVEYKDKQDKIDEWFGTQEKAGKLIFFDAIPIEPVTLIPDVITPHYGKWYEQGNDIRSLNDSEKIPADWHNPVPVPFLAVKDASFLFVIMPRNAADAKEAENAMTALTEALKTIGAGAKTAVGYGYFEKEPPFISELIKKVRESINIKDVLAASTAAGIWAKEATKYFEECKIEEAKDIAMELKTYYQTIWDSNKSKDVKKTNPLKNILGEV